MKKIILFLAISAVTIIGYGQPTLPENTLTLRAGLGHMVRQDLIFSPFIHRDVSPINIGLEYARSGRVYQNISIGYSSYMPMVEEPYQYLDREEQKTASPHYFTFVDIDYLLGKRIIQKGKLTTTLGGLLSSNIQLLNYVYGRVGNTGYVLSFGLGAFIKQDYQITKKHTVSAKLQLPLVYWLARSPYLVNDDAYIENISSHSDLKSFAAFVGDGGFTTISQIQSLNFEIGYTYQLSPKWKVGASYWLEFMHARRPRNLLSLRNSFNLSVNFIF